MADNGVFSLYPQAPTPPQVQNPLEVLQRAAGIQQTLTGTQLMKLNLQTQKLDRLRNTLGGLLADPNVTSDDVHRAMVNGVAEGWLDPTQVANEMAVLPQGGGPALRQYLMNHMAQALDAQQKANALLGTTGLVNQGSQTTPITSGGIFPGSTPAHPIGRPIPIGPTPGESMSPRNVVGPGGQPMVAPAGALPTGQAPVQNPMPGTELPTPPQATVPAPVTGEQIPLQTGKGPGGATPTATLPGGTAVQEASSAKLAADRLANANLRERLNPLTQAIPILQKLGQTKTGPSAAEAQTLRSFAVTNGLITDPNSVSDAALVDELRKYFAQNTAARGSQATDLARMQSTEGNPNLSMSSAGAESLAITQLAYDRMRAAQPAEFERAPASAKPLGDGSYLNWSDGWQKQQDYRGWGFDQMNPKQQQNTLNAVRKEAEAQLPAIKKANPGLSEKDALRQAFNQTPFAQSLAAAHRNQLTQQPTTEAPSGGPQ